MELQETKTGEFTLYIPSMDETYHSRDGAISESKHVFLKEGLDRTSGNVQVLEVGFGTGLNALLTADYARNHSRKIKLETLEPFPVPDALIEEINYGKYVGQESLYTSLHEAPWEIDVRVSDHFTLYKTTQKLEYIKLVENKYDVIFFDAFAPKKQPELWSLEIFQKLYEATKKGGLLTTYSAAGQLKRNLKSVGYTIENPPGANGKREMTVAVK
ncbi:MAG: tRNA (5-methylaminomethyl-2-thiouridine)(34)-methyltransferase MnmD [Bacteroidia bacterium]